jgi:NTE family protein
MKAYAILDGGGVKGAALAGCLQAAWDRRVEFQGYGGTSAGAIVALLACVGYRGDELRSLVTDKIVFTEFLDDGGEALKRLKEMTETSQSRPLWSIWKNRKLLYSIRDNFGLYTANKLETFLKSKIEEKLPALKQESEITFAHLKNAGCPPLKIMVSDLGLREPCTYSGEGPNERNGSVIDAVRASMSYPFVFRPVKINTRYLVDGGLSSNLPIFMFEHERRSKHLPVIAFDLVPSRSAPDDKWTIARFCGDMLTTALESGDHIAGKLVRGVYHVRVNVPEGIDTLDFALPKDKRDALYYKGMAEVHQFFERNVPEWAVAKTTIEKLQALHAPPSLVYPILKAFADRLERDTAARGVRVGVALPTPRQSLIVTYQYGMGSDPDVDWEFLMNAGWYGQAWETHRPVIAGLEPGERWNMTQAEFNKVRSDRKSIFSIPIFEPKFEAEGVNDLNILGVLTVDTSSSLENTQWHTGNKGFIVGEGKRWADILSKVLS